MFNNLNSTLKKILVIFLIITLTYANIALIGNNIIQGLFSYALEGEENIVVAEQELLMNKVCEIDEATRRIIQVAIETGIEAKEKPIKESTLTLKTNIIEGTLVDVKVTELNRNSYTAGTWNVSEDGKLTISLTNINDTLEEKEKGLDKLLVTYVFEESEIETINKPLEEVKVITYGTETLTSKCEASTFEDINIEKELLLNIENKDIHKTTIKSGKVDYTESLKLDLSYRNKTENITIEDVENNFYNLDEQKNEEAILQYNKTLISKEILTKLLGEEGKLTISDKATNKVVTEITSELLSQEEVTEQKYSDEGTPEEIRSKITVNDKTVEIEYVVNVKKIKFELTNIKVQSENEIDISDFVIKNTKSISNVNDIENLNYLSESIKYVINEEKTVNSKITFKDTITRASLIVDNAEWILGKANTAKYTITLDTTSEKSELFVNPMFLIELPTNVESINTSNSEFIVSNDGGAFTGKRVFTTTVLGKKYVVIILTGSQTLETTQNGNTTIDLSLELNISSDETETNTTTKLYYQNDTVTAYENGTSFDTDEVEISLVLNNNEKNDIHENVENENNGADGVGLTVGLKMNASTQQVLQEKEKLIYTLTVYNYTINQATNLILTNTLPENVTLESVTDNNDKNVDYEYDAETRKIVINIESMEAATEEIFEDGETKTTGKMVTASSKIFKITVKANQLEDEKTSVEIINKAKVEKMNIVLDECEVVNTVSKKLLNVVTKKIPDQIKEKEELILEFKVENKSAINEIIDVNIGIPDEIIPRIYKTSLLSEKGEAEKNGEGTLKSNFELKRLTVPAKKTYCIQLICAVENIEEDKTLTIEGTVNGETVSWTTELIKENNSNTPAKPSNPDNPTEPVDPDNPTEPTNPTEPSNPNKPSDPSDPDAKEDTKFDLTLNQYINKIVVTNSEGTTTYDYKDTNFAKVEIHSKYMNGSNVTIEYKMVVKNEGTIPGYARKIVNYKPEGLEFNPEINKDWYVGDDGNIYSITLLDRLLNPGETEELTITFTKQMTNENGGTIKNIMEIYEASNDEDIEDINSIPGDRLEGQNDMSEVQVMIAVKTGSIILYITLTIAVIAIIGLGFYKIKKLTVNKKGGC